MSLPQGPCPVCDKDFKDGDDIVICPSCGAPYHRACYQQVGQCVFTARHASGFEYKSPKAPPSPEAETPSGTGYDTAAANDDTVKGTLCPQCGTINDASNIFCTRCGTPLHTAASPPPGGFGGQMFGGTGGAYVPPLDLSGEIDGIAKKDWAQFIGSSAPVYLPRMAQMQARKGKVSLMLSVFFVSPCYFAYRKMWGWAALALACLLVLQAPTMLLLLAEGGLTVLPLSLEALNNLSVAASYVQLAMQLVFALFALFLYQKHGGKKIRQLRQNHPEEEVYQASLAKKGGVSIIGVVVVIAIIIAASYIFSALFLDELMVALSATLGY